MIIQHQFYHHSTNLKQHHRYWTHHDQQTSSITHHHLIPHHQYPTHLKPWYTNTAICTTTITNTDDVHSEARNTPCTLLCHATNIQYTTTHQHHHAPIATPPTSPSMLNTPWSITHTKTLIILMIVTVILVLHAYVCCSYTVLCNGKGTKQWILYPIGVMQTFKKVQKSTGAQRSNGELSRTNKSLRRPDLSSQPFKKPATHYHC